MQQDQHCCHSTTVTRQTYQWAPAAMPVRRHPTRELTGTALVMFDVLRTPDQAATPNERIGATGGAPSRGACVHAAGRFRWCYVPLSDVTEECAEGTRPPNRCQPAQPNDVCEH